MNKNLPTSGQLERNLSQAIHKLYRQELEHSPGKVTCHIFDNQLAITIENALTAVEQLLVKAQDKGKTVEKLSKAINDTIKLELKALIEAILTVEVRDILFDSTLETKRVGAVAILKQPPRIRTTQPTRQSKLNINKLKR